MCELFKPRNYIPQHLTPPVTRVFMSLSNCYVVLYFLEKKNTKTKIKANIYILNVYEVYEQ